ncbi:MAG: heavy metal translocating P-type ATPase metal-binding domain-containing protein [Bacteroidota bacterium]
MIKEPESLLLCYHCGEPCDTETIHIAEKNFCCQGCKTVYEILNKVELCDYYTLEKNPGLSQKTQIRADKFAFLDDDILQTKLIHYKDATQSHVSFYLPQMHCSSCIWLLEHLGKLDEHIIRSQVNFLKKEVSVVFNHQDTSLRKVTELLTTIGYEPHFSLNNLTDKKTKTYDKSRIYKIGITGFCFGNIMLLSFPEYFSLGNMEEKGLQQLFSYLILLLSLPVFFYGASGFFISAWKSLQQKTLNIDAPIAIAILITFGRSLYEILSQTGAGYLDSMTGIVFFMLIGRFFQDKTYNTMAFNRDYTSYFPLGVTLLDEGGKEKQIPVSNLKTGQRIKVHSGEIIPADCILFLGKGTIDYSFVSGEALPIEKHIGEIIYAGGKQTGGALELEVVKDVSQSYLTQLWNNDAFIKKEDKSESYIHSVSKYFTFVLFSIAAASAIYWYVNDALRIWNAVTSVLIVACPCALLLSATFTNGNMLRILQKYGFYARNAGVIEQISEADTIVFDKTGTITQQGDSAIIFKGMPLDAETIQLIRSLTGQSSHPLSKAIVQSLPFCKLLPVKNYEEVAGLGIKGIVLGQEILMGSPEFILGRKISTDNGSRVYLKINNQLPGYYSVQTNYRQGLPDLLKKLQQQYKIALLSGDNDSEQLKLKELFNSDLLFNQSPQDKLNYIKALQSKGKKVIMTGDGLNDAGALKQSNVGIAVTDNINNFSPACDVIMDGNGFSYFDALLDYCKQNKLIINISFVISIAYNLIGLYFAVQGQLKPVIAAILMPISSISIVLFTTGMSSLLSFKLKHRVSKLPQNSKN